MADITSAGTKDCGVPTCSYKIQDTNAATSPSVCSSGASYVTSDLNTPSDLDDWI